MSQYVTSIGLDVHARSVSACALNPMTGEVTSAVFGTDATEIAQWILSFESPKAVYESGPTGFHLCRELRELGVDCVVGAVSKMQRPASDKRRKTDKRDARFLAGLLACHNVSEVWVPDEACEAVRDLVRALEDARQDLQRARQRLSKFLLRHGYVFDEVNESGSARKPWGRAYWAWINRISFKCQEAQLAFEFYIDQVREQEQAKKGLEEQVAKAAQAPRWKERVDALRCLKGVETATALTLVCEADLFSRFGHAQEFASWLGLVPSEHSSGETRSSGSITKCGNSHCRKLLIEAAWHVPSASRSPKAQTKDQRVAPEVRRHALKGNRRLKDRREALEAAGKRPCVANCATAREMACWVWALGCMVEGRDI